MAIPSKAELLELDVATRLELAEALWDSIATDPDAGDQMPITDAERELIDSRLAQYRADPTSVRPWSDVRDELLKQR